MSIDLALDILKKVGADSQKRELFKPYVVYKDGAKELIGDGLGKYKTVDEALISLDDGFIDAVYDEWGDRVNDSSF